MPELLRIAWRSRTTGASGHSHFVQRDREQLNKVIVKLDKQFPEIQHWIETQHCPVPDNTTPPEPTGATP